MTPLKRVLEMEASGGDQVIHLHRSGIFLSAFNRSALLLLRHCDVNFKVNYKFSKELQQGFASVGFPVTSLDRLFRPDELTVEGDGYSVVTEKTVSDEELNAFIAKAKEESEASGKEGSREVRSVEREVGSKEKSGSYPSSTKEILSRLRCFDIVNSTPMECMVFINKLKKLLTGGTL